MPGRTSNVRGCSTGIIVFRFTLFSGRRNRRITVSLGRFSYLNVPVFSAIRRGVFSAISVSLSRLTSETFRAVIQPYTAERVRVIFLKTNFDGFLLFFSYYGYRPTSVLITRDRIIPSDILRKKRRKQPSRVLCVS